MTRNKKVVVPNITYANQQQNNSSGQSPLTVFKPRQPGRSLSQAIQFWQDEGVLKLNNLEKAKLAIKKAKSPKKNNLQKAKEAISRKTLDITGKVVFQSTPSGHYPLSSDFFKDMQFKVECDNNIDQKQASLMEELLKYSVSGNRPNQNYDKNTNTNKGRSS